MATITRPLNNLVKKDVTIVFTTEHVETVWLLPKRLAHPDVSVFPDSKAALTGERPFRFILDGSADGLGSVIEQVTPSSSARPLCFRS